MTLRNVICSCAGLVFVAHTALLHANPNSKLDLRFDVAESQAVLAILDKAAQKKAIGDGDWNNLFATEGYARLKVREASVRRPFEDADFKAFVQSASLLDNRTRLAATLESWKTITVQQSAASALAYLPEKTAIKATVYAVIKPRDNSFVFDLASNPAIFLYLDPTVSPSALENTIAHELHHVGLASACKPHREKEGKWQDAPRKVRHWIGAFGEGIAMLAAAGGPDKHPHATSNADDRQRWDANVMNAPTDFDNIARFFDQVLNGSLQGKAIDEQGAAFYGMQGPWYTVGWKMATTIETTLGKPRLIASMCNPLNFLRTYNEAAEIHNKAQASTLSTWPEKILKAIE